MGKLKFNEQARRNKLEELKVKLYRIKRDIKDYCTECKANRQGCAIHDKLKNGATAGGCGSCWVDDWCNDHGIR